MESDDAVIALSWRPSPEVRNPSKREEKKNPFPWRFACILMADWEGQIHILNLTYSALRVDWLRHLAPSAKKYVPPVFRDHKVSGFGSTVATVTSPRLSQ
jgi:hypothetical protein